MRALSLDVDSQSLSLSVSIIVVLPFIRENSSSCLEDYIWLQYGRTQLNYARMLKLTATQVLAHQISIMYRLRPRIDTGDRWLNRGHGRSDRRWCKLVLERGKWLTAENCLNSLFLTIPFC